ncbi:hypothetical protein GQ43DRAFT_480870 [Delitschia confertaspora ATCC 74209]|uniref:Fungal N-terminal domain-containing protein n=1 Tax=Delitschia confertaspora ATCC 74209 TaxID=1513339 RepID=A0A9P4MPZ5_9PLEO|nr:hypothetical protein GQ43DRAFT_480870 [Delitschia confertaspora ATCC 74209]
MCDPVSVAGLAFSVAGAGAKLSLTLFDVAHAFKTAPQEIEDIAQELSMLSAVLIQLNDVLNTSAYAHLCKPELFSVTRSTLKRFDEVEKQLNKITSKQTKLTRLKWFFDAPRAKTLLQKVEGIKSALTLIINIIQLAQERVKAWREEPGNSSQTVVTESVSESRLRKVVESVIQANRFTVQNAQKEDAYNPTEKKRKYDEQLQCWRKDSSDTATWLYCLVFGTGASVDENEPRPTDHVNDGSSVISMGVEDGSEESDAEYQEAPDTKPQNALNNEGPQIVKYQSKPAASAQYHTRSIEWTSQTQPSLVVDRLLHAWTILPPIQSRSTTTTHKPGPDEASTDDLVGRIREYVKSKEQRRKDKHPKEKYTRYGDDEDSASTGGWESSSEISTIFPGKKTETVRPEAPEISFILPKKRFTKDSNTHISLPPSAFSAPPHPPPPPQPSAPQPHSRHKSKPKQQKPKPPIEPNPFDPALNFPNPFYGQPPPVPPFPQFANSIPGYAEPGPPPHPGVQFFPYAPYGAPNPTPSTTKTEQPVLTVPAPPPVPLPPPPSPPINDGQKQILELIERLDEKREEDLSAIEKQFIKIYETIAHGDPDRAEPRNIDAENRLHAEYESRLEDLYKLFVEYQDEQKRREADFQSWQEMEKRKEQQKVDQIKRDEEALKQSRLLARAEAAAVAANEARQLAEERAAERVRIARDGVEQQLASILQEVRTAKKAMKKAKVEAAKRAKEEAERKAEEERRKNDERYNKLIERYEEELKSYRNRDEVQDLDSSPSQPLPVRTTAFITGEDRRVEVHEYMTDGMAPFITPQLTLTRASDSTNQLGFDFFEEANRRRSRSSIGSYRELGRSAITQSEPQTPLPPRKTLLLPYRSDRDAAMISEMESRLEECGLTAQFGATDDPNSMQLLPKNHYMTDQTMTGTIFWEPPTWRGVNSELLHNLRAQGWKPLYFRMSESGQTYFLGNEPIHINFFKPNYCPQMSGSSPSEPSASEYVVISKELVHEYALMELGFEFKFTDTGAYALDCRLTSQNDIDVLIERSFMIRESHCRRTYRQLAWQTPNSKSIPTTAENLPPSPTTPTTVPHSDTTETPPISDYSGENTNWDALESSFTFDDTDGESYDDSRAAAMNKELRDPGLVSTKGISRKAVTVRRNSKLKDSSLRRKFQPIEPKEHMD